MRLFLIRHGESEANEKGIYAGQTEVKLTERGREQARAIRPVLEKIHFDRVYTSDLGRAVETQRLAIPGVEGIQTPLLREYDVGSLVGKSFVCAEALHVKRIANKRDYTIFGGENSSMVCDRMREFLSELEKDPCENVAAFAHNGIMLAMLRVVMDVDFNYAIARSGNCAIHVFSYEGGQWRLLAWNYMSSL